MVEFYNLDSSKDITLWHYLDVTRLNDILDGKLWLTRADVFYTSDPNECKSGIQPTILEKLTLRGLIDAIPVPQHVKKTLKYLPNDLLEISEFNRPSKSFIKCFYIGEQESNYMWQNYAKDNGVVIKTSLFRLIQSLNNSSTLDFCIGKVKYENLEVVEDYTNELKIIMTKRPMFCHEQELRLLMRKNYEFDVQQDENNYVRIKNSIPEIKGIKIDIDPLKLIEEIRVSHTSFSSGLKDKDKVIHKDAVKYIKKLLESSTYFSSNYDIPVIYSKYEILPVEENNVNKNEAYFDEARWGNYIADALYDGDNPVKEEIVSYFKENPISKNTILFIVYNKMNGKTEGTARLERPSDLKKDEDYIEIKNEDYSNILRRYNTEWGQHLKVNMITRKLEEI
ncbi:hypothetical protein [Veillonella sp.]|uniref:hypothetical protein n=1 Tax=Veillonella sp. TaxID=1926307 RepID=UPI0025E25840|nr:hypothetical protein [Veillonella sp.]